jgi:hypothetical protein
VVRRAVFSRPKGRAKSELAAMLACCELLGPCRFAGWDADGRPIAGRTGDAEVFQLQQAPGAVCSVLHVGSGASASLGACTCTPK